jgi:NAD(P)-dependent dehydrogenase (short-subunit alcohol dehydrogenase family)
MEEKSIFITGAASGIGRATAELFHEKGWFVGCYDVDTDALENLRQELGGNCLTSSLDVRDKDSFDAAMAAFSEITDGRLDIMFNNAGITVGGYFDEVPFDKIIDIVNINFVGVLNGTHAAIPLLKQTENSLCFNTCSSAAIFGSAGMAVYSATKFAVKGFTEAMSVELARFGSRASDVLPGIIDTPLWLSNRYVDGKAVATFEKTPKRNADRTDASRTIAPSEVAEAVWNAYHGNKLHWYVPPELENNTRRKETPEEIRDAIIAQHKKSAKGK